MLNWVAPSSIKNSTLTTQASTTACILNNSRKNTGVCLLPEFTYKKGQLWMLEASCIKSLATQGVNLDRSCTLQFKERLDARDVRPLSYKGRLMFGQGVNVNDSPWKKTPLVTEGRTQLADQIPTRDMQQVEDVAPDALPSGVEEDAAAMQGAKKCAHCTHLPCKAAHAVLNARTGTK